LDADAQPASLRDFARGALRRQNVTRTLLTLRITQHVHSAFAMNCAGIENVNCGVQLAIPLLREKILHFCRTDRTRRSPSWNRRRGGVPHSVPYGHSVHGSVAIQSDSPSHEWID